MYQPAFPLTRDMARKAYQAGLDAIAAGETEFDFAAVPAVDSTAVAALVGWQRAALRRGVVLVFIHVPDNLQSLMDLYGVSHELPRVDLPHH